MAANYWDSTQSRFWTFTKDELVALREQQQQANTDLVTKYPLPDDRLMNIYFQQRECPIRGS